MVSPKGECSKMVDIFKKFLWGGAQKIRKWSLVSWQGLTKKKLNGGLGLRDPYILNQTMGEKLWWQWIGGGKDLWKQIWTRKYNVHERKKDILRYQDPPKGSMVWNLAACNRHLINQHDFWEIRNGKTTRFWTDSWQQREKMIERQDLREIYQFTRDMNKLWWNNSRKKTKEWAAGGDGRQRKTSTRQHKQNNGNL